MSVGWKLAEEVAWARPERPGPEWWTLMDIAQDARDETRRGMPGTDYLMSRAKCSRATLFRRLKALTGSGLLVVTRHAAPGKRAIYEIPLGISVRASGLNIAETCSGLSVSETRTGERVSKPGSTGLKISDSGLSVSETHAVTAPSLDPSASEAHVVPPSLEGGSPGASNGHISDIERAARFAALSRPSE